MEANTKVWVLDAERGWCPGVVVKKAAAGAKVDIVVKNLHLNVEARYTLNEDDEEHPLVKLQNVDQQSSVENLVNLMILNEPTILQCLENRYKESRIYTYTGPILIAVNPFKQIKDLYDARVLETYYNFGIMKSQGLLQFATIENLPPHAFAIADAAYTSMMSAVEKGFGSKDQSILISGESGAGKTETTKLMLRYLTTVSAESQEFRQKGSVMDKVLQSNPILEAFGNAKTVRNDNSSRFGKFVELHFNRKFNLIGGFLRTYLLEKVRICNQQLGERNYHIFYQMSKGGSVDEKKRWGLPALADMRCANQGGVFDLAGINDVEDFEDVQTALETLEFDKALSTALFDIVAALIHLGQMQFSSSNDGEACVVSADKKVQESIHAASRLLGVPVPGLTKAMVKRTASNKAFVKDLTVDGAQNACSGLTKGVFSKLFDWVASRINKELRSAKPDAITSTIGVLDIFGFESFKENSFEQLCINYTNEALQQQFNKFIFELEQIEYKAEGIEWSFIEFPNNQDCLDLIGLKGKGIFAALDDECHVPKGSDQGFASKMYKDMTVFPRFSVTIAQKLKNQFAIMHYAGPVVYTSDGFLEKNKDEIPFEAPELFGASSVPLVRLIFGPLEKFERVPTSTSLLSKAGIFRTATPSKVVGTGTQSVCTQFSAQLVSLMEQIETTQPHYVRCLKPNDENKPDIFDRLRITEQLKYGGVLEAVRVARAGFPMRMNLQNFFDNYRCLANPFNPNFAKLPKTVAPGDQRGVLQLQMAVWDDNSKPANLSDKVAARKLANMNAWKAKTSTALVSKEQIQLGKTKVFMRRAPYDMLEGRRARFNYMYSSRIQKRIRGYLSRRWYLSVKWAMRVIQRAFRKSMLRTLIRKRIEATRLRPKPKPRPVAVSMVPTPVAATETKKETTEVARTKSTTSTAEITRQKSSTSGTEVFARNKSDEQLLKRVLSGTDEVLDKPDVLVSRKVVSQPEKRYATNDSALDDFYYLLFGKMPGSAAAASSVSKDPAVKPVAVPVAVRATVKMAKKAAPRVAGARRPETETEQAKKSKLGIFFKKSATEEERKEYSQQFPSVWSKSVLLRYFSLS